MKILFISRAFPPITGGIENQNAALAEWLPKFTETKVIANRHGRKALVWFAPYALIKTLFLMRQFDTLLLGDGTLAIIGFIVKKCYPKKCVVSVVHGLDLNYNSHSLGVWYETILITLYRSLWLKRFLPALDGYLAVSTATKQQAIESAALPSHKCHVIPNGVEAERFIQTRNREQLETFLGRPLEGKIILLTLGRLAKRKGAAWFIRHVLPRLNGNILYAIAGSGPDELSIREAIIESQMKERVLMLGHISDDDAKMLLNSSDIFVQPNIRVPGDMEGFGMAVIEAGSAGLPVVASDLEGLRDAVTNGKNGFLMKPEQADDFVRTINELSENDDERRLFGEQAARYIENTFHWNMIAKRYVDTLTTITQHVS